MRHRSSGQYSPAKTPPKTKMIVKKKQIFPRKNAKLAVFFFFFQTHLNAHQHNRTGDLGHDRLHSEPLVIQSRDGPGQGHLQTFPVDRRNTERKEDCLNQFILPPLIPIFSEVGV